MPRFAIKVMQLHVQSVEVEAETRWDAIQALKNGNLDRCTFHGGPVYRALLPEETWGVRELPPEGDMTWMHGHVRNGQCTGIIAAIKEYRRVNPGSGLAVSKHAVEQWLADHGFARK